MIFRIRIFDEIARHETKISQTLPQTGHLLFGIVQPLVAWEEDANRLILNGKEINFPRGFHLAQLKDHGESLTIDDVTQPEFADRFTPNQEGTPNFGFILSSYWIRFLVRNETGQVSDWRLSFSDARLGLINLFYQCWGYKYTQGCSSALITIFTVVFVREFLLFKRYLTCLVRALTSPAAFSG